MIVAAATAIFCAIAFFFIPERLSFPNTLAIYYLSGIYSGLLIAHTGEYSSPFIVLWAILGLFSSVFGLLGWLPFLASSGAFMAIEYINGNFNGSSLVIVILTQLVPIIISPIIWRSKSSKEAGSNKSFKRIANELTEVSSKAEVIINAIGDGVIFVDSQAIIKLINPAAQAILGWNKQDALSLNYRSILQLVDQKDNPLSEAQDPISQVLNSNQQVRTNMLIAKTHSEKKLIISMVVSPVGDAGSGVIVVFRDTTKETAEEREQAEFISTASHEMRTPVASIEGYLGLALNPQTAQVDDRARSYINKAHASAQHLGRLFQDLLDVSKSEDGRMSNNPKVINVVTFVNDLVEGLRPKAEAKSLTLTYQPRTTHAGERILTPDYMINVDNDHLREVVNNLIDNAIKYTPSGGVVVNVTGDEEHVKISIKDSGIGIPIEDIPHLFQKFYRVENKDTYNIGGTGLGLYLCRRLTELMGGRIWLESVHGEGSTFYVELPRLSGQEAASLIEQQKIQDAQQTNEPLTQQPDQPVAMPTSPQSRPITAQPISDIQTPPQAQTVRPIVTQPADNTTNTVPRGDALTPEQIAAYAAKQHALASQQTNNSTQNNPNGGN